MPHAAQTARAVEPASAAFATEATTFVARESPDSAFPFPLGRSGRGGTLVIMHYLPVFPVSIDNRAEHDDYYTKHYLAPEGENGKHARQRGFIRERPISGLSRRVRVWKRADLTLEVARAARIGIDAFGVDLLSLGRNDLFEVAAFDLLDAAQAVDPAFKIIPELDFGGLAGQTVPSIADFLVRFGRHPAAYRVADGRLLVLPLMPEAKPIAFWRELMAEMQKRGMPIAFAPDFIYTSRMDELLPLAWGMTAWGTRTPLSFAEYARWRQVFAKKGMNRWISPVSPQDYRPKDGLIAEAHNSVTYRGQWAEALSNPSRMVHLLTWNDYSESTQIAPSSASQFLWYDLTAYYIAWLKRGTPPPIRRDALYYVHRRQVVKMDDPRRGPPQRNWGGYPLKNEVELVALLKSPGRITIRMGGQAVSRDVGAGLQTLRIPAAPGRPVFSLTRGGARVLEETSDWRIEANPDRHDATYVGGSTTRERVP